MAVRRAEFTNDEVVPDWHARPVRLDLLIVADGPLGFANQRHGLSRLTSILRSFQRPWVRIAVTTAHRAQRDPTFPEGAVGPDRPGFRFSREIITQFDEIWLFGFSRPDHMADLGPPLSDKELQVLVDFMQSGKGVFATGDHEDIGFNLCGRIPRVRSMRRWWFPHPQVPRDTFSDFPSMSGPGGVPMSPPGSNSSRHDTNRPQPGDTRPGDWPIAREEDAIPQPIQLRWYADALAPPIGQIPLWPHPALCSPGGFIGVLPDHPHEGVCERPTVVDGPLWERSAEPEYPLDPRDQRVLPEVIAWASTIGDHLSGGKPMVRSRRFGVIAAYDGSRAAVGRVLTDATWHHFINLNLAGFADDSPHFRQISDYFTNTAVWLAGQELQLEMLATASYMERFNFPLVEEIATPPQTLEEVLRLGLRVRNALSERASVCQIIGWGDPLRELLAKRGLAAPYPRPINDDEMDEGEDEGAGLVGTSEASDAVLGALMSEIVKRFPAPTKESAAVVEAGLEAVVRAAAEIGLQALAQAAAAELEHCRARASVLKELAAG